MGSPVILLLAVLGQTVAIPPENVAKAKEQFTVGQALYQQRKYAEAAKKFEEAFGLRPHPVILFNLAKCYEGLDAFGKALKAYHEYLRLSPKAADKSAVVDSIANLERRLREQGVQQVRVFAEPSDAKIEVDGKDLGRSPASAELKPGVHKLIVSSKGLQTSARDFELPAHKSIELTVTLQPPDAAQPVVAKDAPLKTVEPTVGEPIAATQVALATSKSAPARKGRVFTWVAGGVAVAGLGAGIGLGVTAGGASSTLRGSIHERPEATQLVNTATTFGMGANVSYAVAAAAGVTAVVLFFLEGRP